MPRDGSGVYHRPVGTDAVTDTTIESTKYNANVADVELDLNTPRPIVAGGTGASSVSTAISNLGGERAGQVVTNYDSDPIVAGSFSSAGTATNPPVAGHSFSGICYASDANNMVVEARDTADGVNYVRRKVAGVWGSWIAEGSALYVKKAGDTMTGNLSLSYASPTLLINKAAAGQYSTLFGQTNGLSRWAVVPGDNAAESGSNAGSNFTINRYNDAGVGIDTPFSINRATGLITVINDPTAALGVATKQYADTKMALAGNQTTTGGFAFTTYINTPGTSFTVNPMLGNYQGINNTAAFTITAPSVDCAVDLYVSNSGTAGAISFSGFTVNAANVGDPLTTTAGHRFIISMRRMVAISTYTIKAMQ